MPGLPGSASIISIDRCRQPAAGRIRQRENPSPRAGSSYADAPPAAPQTPTHSGAHYSRRFAHHRQTVPAGAHNDWCIPIKSADLRARKSAHPARPTATGPAGPVRTQRGPTDRQPARSPSRSARRFRRASRSLARPADCTHPHQPSPGLRWDQVCLSPHKESQRLDYVELYHCSRVTVEVSLADTWQLLIETSESLIETSESSLDFGTCSSCCRWQR
jgi:hypothetical protein